MRQSELSNALATLTDQHKTLQAQAAEVSDIMIKSELADVMASLSEPYKALQLQAAEISNAVASISRPFEALGSQLNALTSATSSYAALKPQLDVLSAPLRQADLFANVARQLQGVNALASVAGAAAVPRPQIATRVRREGARLATAADLGAVVRERRKALGMTQQDVADAAGTGRRLVSELEAGKPTLEIGKILAVCQVLGLDLGVTTR